MCHRNILSSKRNPPLKIFARSSETYFAASYQTSTSLDEFRNFSEYSEIYSLPFPPIPTVANMPVIADLKKGRDSLRPATVANMLEIAAVRVQINLDCCKYCPKCCRRGLRSCFELFEMFFEVKKSSFSSRFFSQIAPLSSLEEAVETEVFHSQPSARTEGNRTCSDCRGEQQGKSLLLTFKQTIQNSF